MPFDGTTVQYRLLPIISEMINLLQDQTKWTKNKISREETGKKSYCLLGASWHVTQVIGDVKIGDYAALLANLSDVIETYTRMLFGAKSWATGSAANITRFNDRSDTTHSMIMDVLFATRDRLVALESSNATHVG